MPRKIYDWVNVGSWKKLARCAKNPDETFLFFFKYTSRWDASIMRWGQGDSPSVAAENLRLGQRWQLEKIWQGAKNPTETFFIFSKNNRKQVQSSICAMDALPIVSPNGKWLRCGTKLVAIRCIKYIELTIDHSCLRITVTGDDSAILFTRITTPDEVQQVLRTLYGQLADDA